MDETPVLPRHPLQTVHQYKAKLPQPSGKRGREEVAGSGEGSETEGVSEDEVTEGENEWTPKVTKDDRSAWWDGDEGGCEDMPSTQLLDPRPLAGINFLVVCVCVFARLGAHYTKDQLIEQRVGSRFQKSSVVKVSMKLGT